MRRPGPRADPRSEAPLTRTRPRGEESRDALPEWETAKIFYDDVGEGPLILTTHGVCENGIYWGRTGVSQRLVEAGYRVAGMDMRGHRWSVPTGRPSCGE